MYVFTMFQNSTILFWIQSNKDDTRLVRILVLKLKVKSVHICTVATRTEEKDEEQDQERAEEELNYD